MAQEAAQSVTADVTSSVDNVSSEVGNNLSQVDNISDAQLDKFFESKGEVLPGAEVKKEVETTEEKSLENKELEDKKLKEEQNYKKMAHEERQKRQEKDEELKSIREQNQKMEATLQQIVQRFNAEQQPQIPSYDENPLDHLRIKQEQMEAFIKSQNQQLQNQHQETQLKQSQDHFVNVYNKSLNDYKVTNPQANSAFTFLRDSKIKEYEAVGIPPQHIQELLSQDEMMVVQQSSRDGVNPFDRLYSLSIARGFNPNQSNQQAPINPQIENKMEQIQRGAQASRSLNNVKSVSSGAAPTLDQLSKMDSDEFNEFISNDKNWKSIAKLMP